MEYSMITLKNIYGDTFSMMGAEYEDIEPLLDSHIITPDGKFVTILTSDMENGNHYQVMKEYLEKYLALEKPILSTGDPYYFLKLLNDLGIVCTNLDLHTKTADRIFFLPPEEYLYRMTECCKNTTLLFYQDCGIYENPTYQIKAFGLWDNKIYSSSEVSKVFTKKHVKK